MTKKFVYLFSEGDGTMRNLLGGKGANLAEMTLLGMPVPQGFVITTEACNRYYDDGEQICSNIQGEITSYITKLEDITGKKFGDPKNPLLVSVRSGSRASMPGMMDTILNLGLNDEVVEGLSVLTDNPRFAYDSYRRFIQMFSDVVMGLDKSNFEVIIDELKNEKGVELDMELTADDMKELVKRFKGYYKKEKGEDFPYDAKTQLFASIQAVFRSWNNDRAIVYRRMNDIPGSWGTAVNVQEMVFGNMGDGCGTGVAFTRDPATGEDILYGEYLMNAQGEDVVAGIRTPLPISSLQEDMPEVYNLFVEYAKKLEAHYKDMQDLEFTIENGKLFMLQTRSGKRTASAALKIAVDLYNEGMITQEEAILKVDPRQLDALLHPQFSKEELEKATVAATGLPASPGAAAGKVYFEAKKAKVKVSEEGEKVILVRLETSPEDIEGMYAAEGILTARGGRTSHAAVVARGIGKCCVVGCSEIMINENAGYCTIGGIRVNEGDYISIDGATGHVYIGQIPSTAVSISGDFEVFMKWVDDKRTMKVRANADTPADSKQALDFGAEGIGLCRTEHMFFEPDRISAMRKMILSNNSEQRKAALDLLLPMQQNDFEGIFRVMEGLPVTVRFLDPPLHEFLPTNDEDIKQLASDMGIAFEDLNNTISSLHELNPMMGHRGCRLAVSYPEIAQMQTTAIIQAAITVLNEGIVVLPELMIPLIGDVKELKFVKDVVVKTANDIISANNSDLQYKVGTMIEIPRAALTADKIALEAEFFSFGTNDLTQMTFGFSRDDAGKFLDTYYEKGILESDPFARLDQEGVGSLVKTAVTLGRSTRPDIKLGICGEHGGDPSTVEFCHDVGLEYVSCSPFRVPIARLAAAQAEIKNPR